MSVATPTADVKSETLFDGVAFDPTAPEQYARSFSVNSLTA
jgi:hypothetical protein